MRGLNKACSFCSTRKHFFFMTVLRKNATGVLQSSEKTGLGWIRFHNWSVFISKTNDTKTFSAFSFSWNMWGFAGSDSKLNIFEVWTVCQTKQSNLKTLRLVSHFWIWRYEEPIFADPSSWMCLWSRSGSFSKAEKIKASPTITGQHCAHTHITPTNIVFFSDIWIFPSVICGYWGKWGLKRSSVMYKLCY